MMLEDMLAYQPMTLLDHPSFALLAELDDDARDFFDRTAADIALVAEGVPAPRRADAAVGTLLTALAARPESRAACWRELYRQAAGLVAACDQRSVPDDRRGDLVWALSRLRRFLSENADIADAPIAMLERAAFGPAVGA